MALHYISDANRGTDIGHDLALTMGHKTDDGNAYPYSESNILRMMDKLDHRMILPDLHPGWHIMLQPQDHIDVTDCGTIFFTLSPELLREGGTIEIIAQTIMPGDAIILESNRKLPSGAVINIDTDYTPAPNIMHRPNTDTLHQPLPKCPKRDNYVSDRNTGLLLIESSGVPPIVSLISKYPCRLSE